MKFRLEENCVKIENVLRVDIANPKIKTNGTLFLTSCHLVFVETNNKSQVWIYYSLISSVEKQPLSTAGSPILIKCKHFLSCLFIVSKDCDCQTLNLALWKHSRPGKFYH